MRWTSSAARSGNQIPMCSATPGKRSGSTRKFVAETVTKKKPFFERGSATLRKPRFDPIYYPDRKREEERIHVPAKLTKFALLCKWSLQGPNTDRERHASLLCSTLESRRHVTLRSLAQYKSNTWIFNDVDSCYWFKISTPIRSGNIWAVSFFSAFCTCLFLSYLLFLFLSIFFFLLVFVLVDFYF